MRILKVNRDAEDPEGNENSFERSRGITAQFQIARSD